MTRPLRIAFVAVALSLSLSACTAPSSFDAYRSTIAQFQEATDNTATVALLYVRDINNFEQDYEFKLLEDDDSRQLDARKFLKPAFSPTAIRARSQAFSILKQYTQMLAELAASDAGERWRSATKRVQASGDALATTLSGDGDGKVLKGLPIEGITSPLKTLVDAVGTDIINASRAAALDSAILKAAPAVQLISAGLRDDLEFVEKQRDSVNLLNIADLSIKYEQARLAGSKAARLSILKKVRQALESRNRTVATLQGVRQALEQFDAAHDALVNYAKSGKGPQDISDLIAIVDRYTAVATEAFESYKAARVSQ